MRQAVYSNWILRSTWPWALPVNLIRAYFGEKVALFFSFAAHYTSWLLPLALIGFVAQMQVLQNGYDKSPLLLIFSATVRYVKIIIKHIFLLIVYILIVTLFLSLISMHDCVLA
jgi:hypothetical protein